MNRPLLLSACLLAAAGATRAGGPPQPPERYAVVEIGGLSAGDLSFAADINDRGQVAGVSYSPRGPERAFLWEGGKLTPLGTLGGPGSVARALNDRGQVVGEANPSSPIRHAFLWEDGKMADLGAVGGRRSKAYGINNKGEAVGIREAVNDGIDTPYAPARPFLHREGKMTLLPLPEPQERYLDAWANDINDAGQIAGAAMLAGEQHALFWDGGVPIDINGIVKGSRYCELRALNSKGQAVGETRGYPNGPRRGVLYEAGKVTDLPVLPGYTLSQPRSLNDAGLIVGTAYIHDGDDPRAVRWAGGRMADLNTLLRPNSGWELTSALAINSTGQIAGAGKLNGRARGFVLTPSP